MLKSLKAFSQRQTTAILRFKQQDMSFLSWKRRLFKVVPPSETRALQETERT